MVLSELGARISGSLAKLNAAPSATDELVKDSLKEITNALIASDVSLPIAVSLRKRIQTEVDAFKDEEVDMARVVDRAVFAALVDMLDPGTKPFEPKRKKVNVIMFVGLQGAGKTTTVAKVAHYYKSEGFRTAMVCADTFRAGAYHQLMQNATKLHVPFYGDELVADPVEVARKGVDLFKSEGFEVILVDTSGRHKQEAELFEEMEDVSSAVNPDEVIFVMDGSIGQSAFAQAKAFKSSVDVGSVIITKLDGHAKGGGALSAVAATESPIIFYGTGERFDALEPFDASSFVSKLLGRGDLKGLARKLTKAVTDEDREAILRGFKSKKLSLRDFRSQFEIVSKMGDLGKVAGMMPGPLGQMAQNMPAGMDMGSKVKSWMVLMDSMTEKELDDDASLLDLSRARRISSGAGRPITDVIELLATHKMLGGLMKQMDKAGLMSGSDSAMAKQLQRNPKEMRKKLGALGPQALGMFGGVDGMMDMLKQFGGGGPGGLASLLGGGGGGGGAAGGGGAMPGMPPGIPPGMMGPDGMPDMAAIQRMMGGMGRGRGRMRVVRGRRR